MNMVVNKNMNDKTNTVNFDVQFTNHKVISEVLSGERSPEDLWMAFWFDLTDQGYDYWDRVRNSDTLSNNARRHLFKMIKKEYQDA